METTINAPLVRQIVITLTDGDLELSDSGGDHVEGTATGNREPKITHNGSLLRIQSRGHTTLRLAIPTGVDLKYRGRNGDLTARVRLGSARVATSSGDVGIEAVSGFLEVLTDSGDIDIHQSGHHARLRSGSGDITIGRASGRVEARTGSGDVTVASIGVDTWVESGSGDVEIGIPESLPGSPPDSPPGSLPDSLPGSLPGSPSESPSESPHGPPPESLPTWLDLRSWTGSIDVAIPERDFPGDTETARVRASTASGDIRVSRQPG